MPDLLSLASLFERLAAKKPKMKRFKDGVVILGSFGSPEVAAIIEKEIGPKKLPLIYGDPPYGRIVSNEWDKSVSSNDYLDWTKEALKFLAKGGSLYYWGGIGRKEDRVFFDYLARVEKETGMRLANIITWSKRRAYGKRDDYLFTREELAWLVNGDKPRTFNIPYLDKERGYAGYNKDYPAKSKFLRRTNVWTDITELFKGKVHIAEKPSKLAEIPISVHTKPGEIVMDPFAGSGSTGLAARKLGRRFILVEQDPNNFDIIVNRLITR